MLAVEQQKSSAFAKKRELRWFKPESSHALPKLFPYPRNGLKSQEKFEDIDECRDRLRKHKKEEYHECQKEIND